MDKEIKRLAIKNYLHYFRVWFILVGVAAGLYGLLALAEMITKSEGRGNENAPARRVYDYADVLTGQEEEDLELYIAEREEKYHIDLVLVTINEYIGDDDASWNNGMMDRADDFYDQNNFGYDKVHGDGALLLDNWYEGQGGSWLSTCGSVYERFSEDDIRYVLRAVYDEVEQSPYLAYKAYVDKTCYYMSGEIEMPLGLLTIIPFFVAMIYAFAHLRQNPAKDTTKANTYVVSGKAKQNVHSDRFLRKNITKRIIETSSSSGGSRSHSGGGGGHVSSGGVSHGGGGMRR